jgi:DNA-binding YbaB/EbfC family protein
MLKCVGFIINTKIMGFMDQAKDMYKLQKQAKQIKKELKNIHIEAESDGVTVIFDGEQHCKDCQISEALAGDLKRIQKAVVEANNKAIKKSQTIGAEKMKDVMGGMGGMFGS